MVKRRLYHAFPMLSQGAGRHRRGVRVQRVGLPSRLINMPAHAAFYRSMYSRSDIVMRACRFHHAVAIVWSSLKPFFLFVFWPRRLELQPGTLQDVWMQVLLKKDGVYTLVVYKIYFMQGLIFTCFSWTLFFCINVKYMHLPFPK